MKKLIVTLAALVVATGAFAQLKFGVKAGGNLATISGMTSEDAGSNLTLGGFNVLDAQLSQSMKVGFNVGAWAEYMVMPMLGVQIELNYSTQGVNQKLVTTSDIDISFGDLATNKTTDIAYNSGYINIPILAKAHFANIAAYVGPQFGFATSFNQTTKTTTKDETTTNAPKAVEDYSGFDLSLVFGAQYKLNANIGIDARYNLGLTNVFPTLTNEEGKVTREGYGKQGVIQLGVFYEF